jgi:hypothetical protein
MLVLASIDDNFSDPIEPQLQARQWPAISIALHCIALHWGSIIKQGAIHGQGVARPYRTRQSAKHFDQNHRTRLANISLCQPHRQIEYQRCTGPPVPPLHRWAVWITEPPFYLNAGPRPLPFYLSWSINQRENPIPITVPMIVSAK